MTTMPVTASGYLHLLEGVVFSCGSLECEENSPEQLNIGVWIEVLTSTVTKLTPTRCDFCFLSAPLQEVHQSLCKTKNYCSKICRRADDRVHQVCCGQGDHQVEERKIKIGGQEKEEVADAILKDLVSIRLSSLEEQPQLLASSAFREVLRYNAKLMQKIRLKENQKAGAEVSEVD